jgi:hypothetical protein
VARSGRRSHAAIWDEIDSGGVSEGKGWIMDTIRVVVATPLTIGGNLAASTHILACTPESSDREIHSGAHVGTTTMGVILRRVVSTQRLEVVGVRARSHAHSQTAITRTRRHAIT